MLVLTTKKYEVDEPIKAIDENGDTKYEFLMQLTGEEVNKINSIIFDKRSLEMVKNAKNKSEEELLELEKEIEQIGLENQAKFEDIVFKEHKEPFKEVVGEYQYLEMVDMIFNFFWKAFIEKKTKQLNTMSTDLRKIGSI